MSKQVPLVEAKLAAWARQYLRAHAMKDLAEQRRAAGSVCSGLCWLLSDLLKSASSWDSEQRWIDGMIGAQFAVEGPDRLKVRGRVVWGLSANTAGPQWSELFEGELTLDSALPALRSYTLRFGDEHDLAEKEVKTGLYGTLADSEGGIMFRAFPRGRDDVSHHGPVVAGPEPALGKWVYEFRKG